MTSVFRHPDDDGDLSVFASGSEVLFVCTQGHWWIVQATSSGTTNKSAATKAAAGEEVTGRSAKAVRSAAELKEKFGSDALRAMKFQ